MRPRGSEKDRLDPDLPALKLDTGKLGLSCGFRVLSAPMKTSGAEKGTLILCLETRSKSEAFHPLHQSPHPFWDRHYTATLQLERAHPRPEAWTTV